MLVSLMRSLLLVILVTQDPIIIAATILCIVEIDITDTVIHFCADLMSILSTFANKMGTSPANKIPYIMRLTEEQHWVSHVSSTCPPKMPHTNFITFTFADNRDIIELENLININTRGEIIEQNLYVPLHLYIPTDM